MTEEQLRVIRELREDGYAVVVFTPAEVSSEHQAQLEESLVQHGNEMLEIWEPESDPMPE